MIRPPLLAAVPVLACALSLAACGDDNAGQGKGRAAASQILEGSVSDAMLPLDELQSQSPLAPPEPEKAPTSILSKKAAGDVAATSEAGDAAGTEDSAAAAAPLIPAAPKPGAPAGAKPAAPKPAAAKNVDPIGAAVEAGSRN